MGIVLPFGKYKGSEVEAVRDTDSQYLDWLAQQPDLEKNWPEIFAAISGATEESPVHNALQAQFLDNDICFRLADHLGVSRAGSFARQFEAGCFDVLLGWRDHHYNPYSDRLIMVECKPSIGDDYPAILRQVAQQEKNRLKKWETKFRSRIGSWEHAASQYRQFVENQAAYCVVVYGELRSSVIPTESIEKIFKSSRVSLVSIAEIGGAPVYYHKSTTPEFTDFLDDPVEADDPFDERGLGPR
jgi:hypothetical protein